MVSVVVEEALIASEKVARTFAAGGTPVAFSVGRTLLTLGALVSTMKLRCAGLRSVLPAASIAGTRKRWLPSVRFESIFGEEQEEKAAPSGLHWNVEPDSEETNVKEAEELLMASDGPPVIVGLGGVWSVMAW